MGEKKYIHSRTINTKQLFRCQPYSLRWKDTAPSQGSPACTRTCIRWLCGAHLAQKCGRQVDHIGINSCHLFLQDFSDRAAPSLLRSLTLQGKVTPELLHTTTSVGRTCLFAGQAAEAVLIPCSFWEMKVLDSSMNDTGKDPITVKLSASQPPLPLPLFISLRSLNCNLVIILYRAWADMKHLETVVVTLWDTRPEGI